MPTANESSGVRQDEVYRPPSSDQPDIKLEDIIERVRASMPRIPGIGGAGVVLGIFALLVFIVVIWLATGIFTVSPNEQAALRLFGKFDTIATEGLHWFWPAPIGTRNIVIVTETRRLELGFRSGTQGLSIAQPVPVESQMITGDENIVDVHAVVQYVISNLEFFLFRVDDPGELGRDVAPGEPDGRTLRDVTEMALRQVVGARNIDAVLTTEKEQVQTEVRDRMRQILSDYGTGIDVREVLLQNVNPPSEVQDAFDDVVRAREDRDRLINLAQAYEADQIPRAEGDAARIIEAAEGFKAGRIAKAEGEALGFLAVLEGYRLSPEVTRQRLYLEAMEDILPNTKKFILSEGAGVLPLLPLEPSQQLPAIAGTGGQ